MRLSEIADIVPHPGLKKAQEYARLLHGDAGDIDDMVEYIMDDNNPEQRRLNILKHLDLIVGDARASYTEDDLTNFMFDVEGPPDFAPPSEEDLTGLMKDLKLPPHHLSLAVDNTTKDSSHDD